jgi:hypothetical protein
LFPESLPTGPERYGTTGELFSQISTTIVKQTCLSNQVSAVLTYWAISTWFLESLPLAPCLVITGSSHEGNGVLQTLKAFCRHPFLMAGVSEASLKNINWNLDPTLLLSEPNLSKRMTALLGSSTSPGYLVGSADSYKDYFCSKAIYLGENLPIHSMPPFCVHVNAAAMSKAGTKYAKPSPDAITQRFQNRLLCYRLSNWQECTTRILMPQACTQTPAPSRTLWGRALSIHRTSRQNLFPSSRRTPNSYSAIVRIASRRLPWKPLSRSATRESFRSLLGTLRRKLIVSAGAVVRRCNSVPKRLDTS